MLELFVLEICNLQVFFLCRVSRGCCSWLGIILPLMRVTGVPAMASTSVVSLSLVASCTLVRRNCSALILGCNAAAILKLKSSKGAFFNIFLCGLLHLLNVARIKWQHCDHLQQLDLAGQHFVERRCPLRR